MGERIKAGIFRPSCKTIPYSQITGALRSFLGSNYIHAVGVLDCYKTSFITYSPQERIARKSKIPITAEALTEVAGRVYIVKTNLITENLPKNFEVALGGLRMKGFGACKLEFTKEITNPNIGRGILATRIPYSFLDRFMIRSIVKPFFGYLFRPTSDASGVYIKSIFEGSEVVGPDVLLEGGIPQ